MPKPRPLSIEHLHKETKSTKAADNANREAHWT